MSTTNLPNEYAGWTASQKQSILIYLIQEMTTQGELLPCVIGGGNQPSYVLLGPFNSAHEIALDDSTPERRELRRRHESLGETTALEPLLEQLMNEG